MSYTYTFYSILSVETKPRYYQLLVTIHWLSNLEEPTKPTPTPSPPPILHFPNLVITPPRLQLLLRRLLEIRRGVLGVSGRTGIAAAMWWQHCLHVDATVVLLRCCFLLGGAAGLGDVRVVLCGWIAVVGYSKVLLMH